MNDNSSSTGLGVLGVCQVVFIILKLLKLINWSWWVVLIPLWIEIAITLIVFVCLVFVRAKYKKR
jgi:hypothetical protein